MMDIKKILEEKKRFQKIDKDGRIYIPKEIRDQFKDCYFYIRIDNKGRIVLDPIKLKDIIK